MSKGLIPDSIEKLMNSFGALPGIGRKSARRLAYEMVDRENTYVEDFAKALLEVKESIHPCSICGNLTDQDRCVICADETRDSSIITVVKDSQSILSIEKSRSYRGLYHVLGGLLSPQNNMNPDSLNLDSLLKRAKGAEVKEIILALSPTNDGELTSHFLQELLIHEDVLLSRIAQGIPIGANLDTFDEGSLMLAIQERRALNE